MIHIMTDKNRRRLLEKHSKQAFYRGLNGEAESELNPKACREIDDILGGNL